MLIVNLNKLRALIIIIIHSYVYVHNERYSDLIYVLIYKFIKIVLCCLNNCTLISINIYILIPTLNL